MLSGPGTAAAPLWFFAQTRSRSGPGSYLPSDFSIGGVQALVAGKIRLWTVAAVPRFAVDDVGNGDALITAFERGKIVLSVRLSWTCSTRYLGL